MARTYKVRLFYFGGLDFQYSFHNVHIIDGRIGSIILSTKSKNFQGFLDTLNISTLRTKGWYYTFCNKEGS